MQPEDRNRVTEAAADANELTRQHVRQAGVRARYYALDDDWQRQAGRRLDLETALGILSASGAPLDSVDIPATLDSIADEIGARLSGDRAYDVGMGVLSEVLSRDHGLRGNANDYYAPENSYLGSVLATGLGIPISLCSIAILVGRRLELPVAGIGAPGHFLGFYGDVHLKIGSFFDPFDGFQRLHAGQLQTLLSQYVTSVEPAMLKPVSDAEIVARFVRNLVACYAKRNDAEHIRNLERWNLMISA
ncbi:MAG: transglutaminase family protein [Planctomycetes bacterium]|nr:transglutaminase family protein [Planctomycetota bacterium]